MREFFLIRHAPTAWNRDKRIQGRADVPLSAEGLAEAAAWRLPDWAAGWPCLSSPLRRALDTGRAMGLDPRPLGALVEMHWGAIEGRTLAEARREGGAAFAAAEADGLDFRPPGGESPREVGARVVAGLAGVARNSVLLSHKGVVRALFALATGWDMRSTSPVRLAPASGHRLGLRPDGTVVLLAANIALRPAGGGGPAQEPPSMSLHP